MPLPKRKTKARNPEQSLLEQYQKARTARKKAGALEDIARAKITAKGYEIENEYDYPATVGGKSRTSGMKLRPLAGLSKGKK